ncbi:MAG: hypothetical protein KGM49_00540 [Sphingomonadales bacterium]|nr:hypothetical protein [Sphingomonadales bacterium]
MSTPVNLVKINVISTGSGALMLGSAVPGYRGSEVLISGREYSYSIKQNANYEFGRCTYFNTPSPQMVRAPIDSSDGGVAISLTAGAQVALVLLVEDLLGLALPGALAVENNLSDLASVPTARSNLALGTAAVLNSTTDVTLAGNSDFLLPTEKAIKTYTDTAIASAVVGLLDFKGGTDCSANPNYPAALKGDAYVVTVAGKIGGASGTAVDAGDWYIAKADNAGGTEAAVGANWTSLEHNGVFGAPAMNTQTVVSAATVTPLFTNDFVTITAQAIGLTLANWSGTAVNGWGMVVRIKDNGTSQTIAYGSNYIAADGVTLPGATTVGKTHELGFVYNDALGKFVCISTLTY